MPRRRRIGLILFLGAVVIGCEPQSNSSPSRGGSNASAPPPPPNLNASAPPPPNLNASAPPPHPNLSPSAPPAIAPPGLDNPSSTTAADASGSLASAAAASSKPPAGYERKVAEVGVGKKGRGYGGGIVSEPIRQKFRIEQRIVFLQVQKALNEFKAFNDRLPKSHEEFMTAIVAEYGLQLPELPQGERYVYDPQAGELMVERPVTP